MPMTVKIQEPSLLTPYHLVFEGFREEVTVGRSSRRDVRLPFSTVSSHHLTFRQRHGVWEVRDEGSTNGTTLDGRALTPGEYVQVAHGATLRILEITFHVDMYAEEGFTIGEADGMTQEMVRTILKQKDEDIAFLEVVRGESYHGQRFQLHDELKEVFVGAAQGALIPLRASDAPARLFLITRQADGFAIAPATPETPLALSGEPISSPRPLSHGDRIEAGGFVAIFRDPLEGFFDELDGLPGQGGDVLATATPLDEVSPVSEASHEGEVAAPAILADEERSEHEDEPAEPEPPRPKKREIAPFEVFLGALVLAVIAACIGLLVLVFSSSGAP